MWEDAQTFQRYRTPNPLEHSLRISLCAGPGAAEIAYAEFFVQADARVQAYLDDHPTFSKDAWPFGLVTLGEWMWGIKYLEVDAKRHYEGVVIDAHTGGQVKIDANFCRVDGQGWFVPLVNWANTHIPDQLAARFAENSAAVPDPPRIPILRAEAAERRHSQEISRLYRQIRNRTLLIRSSPDLNVFVDESGDTGLRKRVTPYSFSAVIVEATQVGALQAELKSALSLWGHTSPREIHFTKVPARFREAVATTFARAVLDRVSSVHCYIFEKWGFLKHLLRNHAEARRAEEFPCDLLWEELISDPQYAAQAAMLAKSAERVVIDLGFELVQTGSAGSVIHDRKHIPWMNRALEEGFKVGRERPVRLAREAFGDVSTPPCTFALADSALEPILWLPDWISHELGAWTAGGELSPAFKQILPKLSCCGFDELGRMGRAPCPGAEVEYIFPDLSIEL
jgi:hypothetical protein